MKCEQHPGVETSMTCSNCGRPICPKCMVYTPVGNKCPECARQRGRAVAGLKPIYYVRAVAAGLGAGLVAGILLVEVVRAIRFGSLLFLIIVAMAIGEAVSRAARRNTGPALQIIAGSSAALAFLIGGYLTGVPILSLSGWHGLVLVISPVRFIFALLGIYLAAAKLKD